jgi:hypothetical protein
MSAYTWLGSSTHTVDETTGWPKAGVSTADSLTVTRRNGCNSGEALAGNSSEDGSATIWTLLLPSILMGEEVKRFPL